MLTNQPFEDILQVVKTLDEQPFQSTCSVNKRLTRYGLRSDSGAGEIYAWLASSQEVDQPLIAEVHICVFASSYSTGQSPEIIKAFIKGTTEGKAPVNRLCVDHGIGLRVLELAPDMPHDVGQNWSALECTQAVAFGMEAAAAGGNLLCLSDFAPGNDAGKLAVIASCAELGAGALLDGLETDEGAVLVEQAKKLLNDQSIAPGEEAYAPLEALKVYGGREVAACVGAMIAARSRKLPVIIEGWASLAAYAIMAALSNAAVAHVKLGACECSLFREVARKIGLEAIIGIDVDAGPGCGGALSVSTIKGVVDVVAVE